MLACKHNNKHNSEKKTTRLSRTILYLFISQIFCVFPYLILFSITIFDNTLPHMTIGPWLVILRNSQCFFNGLILLKNQKKSGKVETFFWRKVKGRTVSLAIPCAQKNRWELNFLWKNLTKITDVLPKFGNIASPCLMTLIQNDLNQSKAMRGVL